MLVAHVFHGHSSDSNTLPTAHTHKRKEGNNTEFYRVQSSTPKRRPHRTTEKRNRFKDNNRIDKRTINKNDLRDEKIQVKEIK